ncbi:MAG: hypothetical protein QXO93_06765 [Acidilobaceae archaeon]
MSKPTEVTIKIRRRTPTATTLIRKAADELKKAGYKRVYLDPVQGAVQVKVNVQLSAGAAPRTLTLYAV